MSDATTLSQPEIVFDKEGNEHIVVDFNNDYDGAKLGFWVFLLTEIMIFGSMFLVYAFYMFQHSTDFVHASEEMNRLLGGINTFILLVSALTMGLSLVNLRNGHVSTCKKYIWTTLVLATIFLAIKATEWTLEIHHGLYPNSPVLDAMSNGTKLFFGLYFTLTGLHGIHIIVGIIVMLVLLRLINKGAITSENYVFL